MSIKRGIENVVYIFSGVLVIKKNKPVSLAERWMDFEPVTQSEVSQKEKNI